MREGHEATDPVRRIVVAVDGAAEATAALQWAYETATLHDASVEIVGAWTFPVVSYERMAATPLNPAPFEDVARSAIEKSIAPAAATTVTDVKRTVAFGSPAAVILGAACTRSASSWGHVDSARSPAGCSARSAVRSRNTRRARWVVTPTAR